ncbi:MAG: IS1/IS6 family transposase [Chloroflexi bacterium]|nr:IS1/IS6 family transposase [Chloroflexota bacterium]MBI4267423.1 IS1/IS6 family transposase [Chloroflexota bacterium]
MPRRIHHMEFDEVSGKAIIQRRNVITTMRHTTVKCKFCGDWESVVQYGKSAKGGQRYLCQKCRRTFMNNKAPERMRYPAEVIAAALNLFYESASLYEIQRQLKLSYGVSPHISNIYRWITRYTKAATRMLGTQKINVGSTWIADETVLKLKSNKGENTWFWDIIDDKTKFLLASHMTKSRTTSAAESLMRKAENRTNTIPKTVVTDKLQAYLDAIEKTWGADTEHVQSSPFIRGKNEDSTRAIERFHGTLKDRTKVMRALADKETAQVILEGWLIHYNFFRPHMGLKDLPPKGQDKTPAEVANVKSDIKSWLDVVNHD